MADPAAPPDPVQALAAAVRERLAAAGEAVLPGVGTLRRRHEAARVEMDAAGRRVLMPPRDTVHFEPA
jgi:hypothetical protein